ncbi:STAS domain-containing protein [Hoeflea sp. TYP-13]|uniref:STAS domain-containing protein n=1 Tax=Hoeflea sp. TYP-13 TaxID=3230023 RepID=UPI0034C5CBA6
MSVASQTEIGQMQLPENLDLTAVTPLHKDLVSMRGSELVVDASAVERLGGQCVQLLLSASKSWAEDGVSFQIENASDSFLSAIALLGVEPDSLHVKEQPQ